MSWSPARALTRLVLLAGTVTGCTASTTAGPSTPAGSTVTHTVTATRTPPITVTPPSPAASVRPLTPGARPARGAVEKRCPYIRTGLDQDQGGGVNVADLEGDRIYRTVVLTRYRPAGCRFYFYAPPYEAVADILPSTYPTAADAHNALVLTARTGTEQLSEPNFARGLDGICFRTRFFGPDGARDWAFAFSTGRVLVVVHTQRSDTSRNALYLGQAIAAKF